MQHLYTYTQKPANHKAAYKTLLTFSAKLLLVIIIAFLVMLLNISKASAQGQLDPSFNAADNGATFTEGANNDVRSIALQADGKIIIGGTFTSFNGALINRIARINADGSLDASFNTGSGLDNTVNDLLVQNDGKIILAGAFTNYNGAAAPHIIRLNTDGSRDAGFVPGTGTNAAINTISIQAGGKIIAGGDFTTYNTIASNHIVRLNANGSRDAAFSGTIANTVADIAVQSDGKLLVGINNDGDGLVTKFLTRLSSSGSADASFNVGGAGANGSVKTIAIQTDGKIVFGGMFTSYNNINTNLTRISSTGTLDPAFDNSAGGFPQDINAIALQADGKIVVGWGYFMTDTYDEGKKVNRLNANGTGDASFNFEFVKSNLDENVFSIAVQPDGKILVAETYVHHWDIHDREGNYFGEKIYLASRDFKINRYNADGSRDQAFCINTAQKAANRPVNVITTQADGKALVGGYFYSYNGVSTNYLARLNADGSKDPSFNATGVGPNSYVYTILVQPDGKILVGGMFSAYNRVSANGLIRLNNDGSKDASFNYTEPTVAGVKSLSLQADGKILVGGFGTIIRLNTNGTKDLSFNTTIKTAYGYFFPYIDATVTQPDGKILMGGYFSGILGDGSASNLVRLNSDGSGDISFDRSFYCNYEVFTLALQSDGKFIVGGAFEQGNYLMRRNANGSVDNTFNPGGSGIYNPPGGTSVNKVLVQADNKILVAGAFTAYNGTTVNRIMRLNPNGTLDAGFNAGGAGTDLNINTIALQSGGSKILLAGHFTSYNGNGKNRIARIFGSDAGAPIAPTNAVICPAAAPYVWHGNNYTLSGTYTAVVNNPDGSVSVDTLKLTIGAGEISGPNRACLYAGTALNANYNIIVPAGSTITWSVSKAATMQIINGQGTNNVNIKYLDSFTTGYVYARVVNAACSIDIKKTFAVNKSLPSTPLSIVAGSSSLCAAIGTTNAITYTIRKVAAATSYNWAAQAGTTTIIHPNGAGINDTTVNILFAAGYTTSAVSVQAVNDCGSSNLRTLTVSRSNPSTPSAITGPTNPCPFVPDQDNAFYSVTEVAGLTYTWTVPAGISFFSYASPSHNQIAVRFSAGYTTGVFSVTATNGCGSSTARSITVKKLLTSTPGTITATNTSACPNRQYTYSVASMPANALYVQWTVPAGGTILSGQGTTSITVNYNAGLISGSYVTAQGINNCSSSSVRKLAVSLTACPPVTPFARNSNEQPSVAQVNPQVLKTEPVTIPVLTIDEMEVKVFPNPSVSDFKLQVISSGKEEINVRVIELQGKVLKQITIAPHQIVNIGADFKTGSYFIEVRQGRNVKTTRIIKF
ncbi:MAG: T9SS type A sorting domain-containing protein [Ferruginibacter sp.]